MDESWLKSVNTGDVVKVTGMNGRSWVDRVTSAGPVWITVGRTRYHRRNGRIESEKGIAGIGPVPQSGTGTPKSEEP